MTLDSSQEVGISHYSYSSWSCWLNQSYDFKSHRNVIPESSWLADWALGTKATNK